MSWVSNPLRKELEVLAEVFVLARNPILVPRFTELDWRKLTCACSRIMKWNYILIHSRCQENNLDDMKLVPKSKIRNNDSGQNQRLCSLTPLDRKSVV